MSLFATVPASWTASAGPCADRGSRQEDAQRQHEELVRHRLGATYAHQVLGWLKPHCSLRTVAVRVHRVTTIVSYAHADWIGPDPISFLILALFDAAMAPDIQGLPQQTWMIANESLHLAVTGQ